MLGMLHQVKTTAKYLPIELKDFTTATINVLSLETDYKIDYININILYHHLVLVLR